MVGKILHLYVISNSMLHFMQIRKLCHMHLKKFIVDCGDNLIGFSNIVKTVEFSDGINPSCTTVCLFYRHFKCRSGRIVLELAMLTNDTSHFRKTREVCIFPWNKFCGTSCCSGCGTQFWSLCRLLQVFNSYAARTKTKVS